ncbi:MAG: VanW family protein [Flavobacteriaceae bacterium]|nr:VanW family protein [Flavobacteriaceae bacterium]
MNFHFSAPQKEKTFPFKIVMEQPFMDFPLDELKRIACKINSTFLKPNRTFSFWKIVGKHSGNEEILSQTAGIIYHLALVGGLRILERHCHEIDFFTDENRPFPLGTDAWVHHKNKDLKIKNTHNFFVKFQIEILDGKMTGELLSIEKITPNKLEFKRVDYLNRKEIYTRINRRTVAVSSYKNL